MNQTTIYFNPELDTVHIMNHVGDGIRILSKRTNPETVQSIKVLAIAVPGSIGQAGFIHNLSRHLPALERLETFILVIEGETESARKNMEDALIKANERLRLEGKCGEWKVPVVKVMNSEAFESHLSTPCSLSQP
jgi:hypothetical protein